VPYHYHYNTTDSRRSILINVSNGLIPLLPSFSHSYATDILIVWHIDNAVQLCLGPSVSSALSAINVSHHSLHAELRVSLN
jgi:hypothetical protein